MQLEKENEQDCPGTKDPIKALKRMAAAALLRSDGPALLRLYAGTSCWQDALYGPVCQLPSERMNRLDMSVALPAKIIFGTQGDGPDGTFMYQDAQGCIGVSSPPRTNAPGYALIANPDTWQHTIILPAPRPKAVKK